MMSMGLKGAAVNNRLENEDNDQADEEHAGCEEQSQTRSVPERFISYEQYTADDP